MEGVDGIYFASQLTPDYKSLYTVVTFDNGGEWQRIAAPDGTPSCSDSTSCGLNLDLEYGRRLNNLYVQEPVFSRASAPGYILATGNTGASLTKLPGMYVSQDAGLSWSSILQASTPFQVTMLDHGGIMVAARPYDGVPAQSVYYSIDEGRTWTEVKISNNPVNFVALLTEPGESTTVASIWGYAPSLSSWLVITMNFTDILGHGRMCTADDYVQWSPRDENSPLECILGARVTYERRAPDATCVNGRDYDRPVSETPCACQDDDFECDEGFFRVNDSAPCVPNNVTVTPLCKPGQNVTVSRGYRRVQGDKCTGGYEALVTPIVFNCPNPCPTTEWAAWAPCDVCTGEGFTTRRRQKIDPQADDDLCPCLLQEKPCEGSLLNDRVAIAPDVVHVGVNEKVFLATVLSDDGLSCSAGEGVFGNVSYLWTLPANSYVLGSNTHLKDQVLQDVQFSVPGIFNIQVTVR